jgi:ankyrin repeat protein
VRHVVVGDADDTSGQKMISVYFNGRAIKASTVQNQSWLFPNVDFAILEVSQEDYCRATRPEPLPPAQNQIMFRERTGTLRFYNVTLAGQSPDGMYLIKDPSWPASGNCLFETGRSGSLVMTKEGKLLGFLFRSVNCVGSVVPIDAVNQVLMASLHIRLPLNERSDQLIRAAYAADEQTFNDLLRVIDDANTMNGEGSTPLAAIAVSGNNFDGFNQRFGPKAAGETDDEYHQLVCKAWVSIRARMAKELFRLGARADGQGGNSWTPLMNAVTDGSRCGNETMVELLLKNGAAANQVYLSRYSDDDPSKHPWTPLWQAVRHGFLESDDGSISSVSLLLRSGADPNLRIEGMTPILALAVDSQPDWVGQGGDSSCWSSDNSKVALFRVLAAKSDLSVALNSKDEFNGLTVRKILERRLGGGCKQAQCEGVGRAGRERCLERMLGALPN